MNHVGVKGVMGALLWAMLSGSGCLSNEGRGQSGFDVDDDGVIADLGSSDTVDMTAQDGLSEMDAMDAMDAIDIHVPVDSETPDDLSDGGGVPDVVGFPDASNDDVLMRDDDIVIPPECVADEECGLGALVAPCYTPVCVEGTCQVLAMADGSTCDDSDLCTTNDQCVAGTCAGIAVDCEDANPCTVDNCVSDDGSCHHDFGAANQVACDDSDLCTTNDVCMDGVCAGIPLICQDGNSCTADSCSKDSGTCVFDPGAANGSDCDDNDGCTTGEVCSAGSCGGGVQVCACQQDADCPDDGDLCNGTYVCKTDGAPETWTCVVDPGTVVTCPTAGDTACLKNTCDKLTGWCANKPVDAGVTCNDSDACTLNDACNGAGQCQGTAKVCTDGLACTSDVCAADGQCVFSISPLTCLIANVCYNSGATMPGNGCLSCQPNTNNQVFSPNSANCDDGNACTVLDVCGAGSCKPGIVKSCDDNDPCTDDTCVAPSGQCKSTDNGSCPEVPTYTNDIKPIFLNRCGGCHEGSTATDCLGGTCLSSLYAATQLPSYYCPGESVGACCLTRVLDGTMPDGFGCTGKPEQDAPKGYCFNQNEIDTLEAWIVGGEPE